MIHHSVFRLSYKRTVSLSNTIHDNERKSCSDDTGPAYDASLEDAMRRLFLLPKIERALQRANAGESIPHEKVKERMAKGLK